MEASKTTRALLDLLPFDPTPDQEVALEHIGAFEGSVKSNPLYILKGYAGTGKTTIISTYTAYLQSRNKSFVLLAPTGRAAKVLAHYTGLKAFTIHRQIYQFITSGEGYQRISLAHNPLEGAVFIVDEASMINDASRSGNDLFGARNLLDDLVNYVFSRINNKLLLVGDTAQLPPVGMEISPALDLRYIKNAFTVRAHEYEMKAVMRQALDSGVLFAATALRQKMSEGDESLPYFTSNAWKEDIVRINNGAELEELLNHTFQGRDLDRGIVVCRSNKRANLFNEQVRRRILQHENEIEGGDFLMVVKNNYYWLDEASRAGFIANGDLVRVIRVRKTMERYGFRFADVELALLDYPDEKEFEARLMLDTLTVDGPALSRQDHENLYLKVEEDYAEIPERRKRMDKVGKDPFYNALQVKYAYAMTCHKTQGGQWPVVIVDQGYLNDEMIGLEYQRWLYTAITRSTDKVFLVNFRGDFFEGDDGE